MNCANALSINSMQNFTTISTHLPRHLLTPSRQMSSMREQDIIHLRSRQRCFQTMCRLPFTTDWFIGSREFEAALSLFRLAPPCAWIARAALLRHLRPARSGNRDPFHV